MLLLVALVSLLPTLVWPGLRSWLERLRVDQAVKQMVASLQLARMEGLRRGGQVVLARLSGSPCAGLPASPPRDWSCGWELFVDANGDRQRNPGELLLQQVLLRDGTQVQRSVDAGVITVNAWGRWAGVGLGFTFAPASGEPSASVLLCGSAGGRLRTQLAASRCEAS